MMTRLNSRIWFAVVAASVCIGASSAGAAPPASLELLDAEMEVVLAEQQLDTAREFQELKVRLAHLQRERMQAERIVLEGNIRQAEARIHEQQPALEALREDQERFRQLHEKGAVPAQEVHEAELNVRKFQTILEVSRTDLNAERARLHGHQVAIEAEGLKIRMVEVEARAAVAAAETRLTFAQRRLDFLRDAAEMRENRRQGGREAGRDEPQGDARGNEDGAKPNAEDKTSEGTAQLLDRRVKLLEGMAELKRQQFQLGIATPAEALDAEIKALSAKIDRATNAEERLELTEQLKTAFATMKSQVAELVDQAVISPTNLREVELKEVETMLKLR